MKRMFLAIAAIAVISGAHAASNKDKSKDVNVVNTPDVSVVSTPALEVYQEYDPASGGPSAFKYCFFDVPPGKILQIEKITGQFSGTTGAITFLTVRNEPGGGEFTYLFPRSLKTGPANGIYEALNGGYAADTNWRDDGGSLRDIEVIVRFDSTAQSVICRLIGRLFDAPPSE